MARKWCRDCQRWVDAKRSGFNTLAFLFLLIIGAVPAILLGSMPIIGPILFIGYYVAYWWLALLPAGIYLIYHYRKPERCPICNSRNFGPFAK